MLRRAGSLLARQLSQIRSHSNKVRLLGSMLPSTLVFCFFCATDKTTRCSVGALWASFNVERVRRHVPACPGFQARQLACSLLRFC